MRRAGQQHQVILGQVKMHRLEQPAGESACKRCQPANGRHGAGRDRHLLRPGLQAKPAVMRELARQGSGGWRQIGLGGLQIVEGRERLEAGAQFRWGYPMRLRQCACHDDDFGRPFAHAGIVERGGERAVGRTTYGKLASLIEKERN